MMCCLIAHSPKYLVEQFGTNFCTISSSFLFSSGSVLNKGITFPFHCSFTALFTLFRLWILKSHFSVYNAYIIRYLFSSGGIFINSTRESFFLAPPKPSGAVGCSNVSVMSFHNFSCSLTVLSPQAFSCSMPPCWHSNARDSPSQFPAL